MCAIAGLWNLDQQPVHQRTVEKFTNALAHRGPDGSGVYIDEQAQLALGHRRLSIIDLSEGGKQPMFSADDNLVISFNGEIYNYIELKAELKAKGHVFRSQSDTEVILAAFKEWGQDCQFKFNGMWAFAIWDKQQQTLFLSRDRFGVKPLYYVYQPNKLFAFASESIAFNQLDGYKKEISRRNINLGIKNIFYLEAIGETIYQGISKLRPGHSIIFKKNGKPQIKKWWKTEEHLMDVPTNYEEQVETFRSVFTDACRLRLRSDVPVGIALSGGLDSSSVYCTIQQIYKENLAHHQKASVDWQNAFIACFPDTEMDEKVYADEVVKFTNGKPNYIYPHEQDICDAIVRETKIEDFIYLSPPVVHAIYAAMRRNNIKVSLDGHGADEMLFGYSNMVAEWISYEQEESNSLDLYRTWADMQGKTLEEAYKAFNGASATAQRSIVHELYDTLIPASVKRIYRKKAFESKRNSSWLLDYTEFQRDWDKIPFSAPHSSFKIAYRKFHVDMLPTLLRNWDRASMRHGVEIRMPFMDWRLITYVFSLPGSTKVNEGYTKKIVRDAMKGWMPESIRLRKNKIGINAPMAEWFNGPMNHFILDVVHSSSFLQSDIWNGPLLCTYAKRLCEQKQWTQGECNQFWPYLNAWILLN